MSEPDSRVAAVILNFHGWPAIATTLRALRKQLAGYHVTVVDNSGDDQDATRIAKDFPELALVISPNNDGYASGMNLGVTRSAETEFVFLLTHECVIEPRAIANLVAELERHPRAAIAAPLLGQASTGAVWSAGGIIKRRSGQPRHLHAGEPVESLRGAAAREVVWADGAALLVRRRALADVGGLDERFFLYCEEVDLALRLRTREWRVRVVPSAVAWQEPGSGGTPAYLEVRNRLLLWKFNRRPSLLAAALAYTAWQILADLLTRRWRRAGLRAAGLRDGFTGGLDRARAAQR